MVNKREVGKQKKTGKSGGGSYGMVGWRRIQRKGGKHSRPKKYD